MKILLWVWAALWALVVIAAIGVETQNPYFVDVAWVAALPALGVLGWRRSRRAGALALAAAAGWGLLSRAPSAPAPARLVVMGVDGATFDVIHALDLPNFAALERDGAAGRLMSMEPMFSPLLWTTMASGRPPDEHGIRGFRVQSKDCRVARWWDVAEDHGDAVGLYKWLVDYPPRTFAHGGFWVPSWLAPAPEAWPAELSVVKEVELANRLRRKQVAPRRSSVAQAWDLVRVGVRLSTLVHALAWSMQERFAHPDDVTRNVRMQLIRGAIDRDVFVRQLHVRRPDVASFNYYATDGLGHLYWDRYARGEDQLRSAYRQADEILGDLRRELAPDARLVLVSDHGFKAMDGTGLAGQFAPLTERLRARLTDAVGPVDVSKLGHKLTVGFQDAAQKERGAAFLATLVDGRGEPVYAQQDLPDLASGLGLTLADEAVTAERMASDTVGGEPFAQYVTLTDAYTGTHEPHGVIFVYGRDVPAGGDLGEVSMLDVAPTILAAAGLPADEQMKGHAQVFPEVPRVASWGNLVLTLSWLDGEAGANDDALKALGYIGDASPPGPRP